MSLQRRISNIFGTGALSWIDRAYFIDWTVIASIWILSYVFSRMPVYERDFSVNDPLISHPHKHDQIGGALNNIIALYVPIGLVGAVGGYRSSAMDIHHGIIAVSGGRGLARLVTEFMKNRVGRLRPDFLARCKYDAIFEACTGKAEEILDGRRSFPSGHSSGAFAGMTFLSLWLAIRTSAWAFHSPSSSASIGATRVGRFMLTILPLFWATFVAITRIEDYRHHKEDVIVGSLIGILSATVCFLIFWPNPFSTEHSLGPRALYTERVTDIRREGFELTSLHEPETV